MSPDATAPSGAGRRASRRTPRPRASPRRLDFKLKDMHGVDVKLESFKGKVILLNFWATWCGPCKAEIPSLVELQEKYADDLVVLGFSVDDHGREDEAVRRGVQDQLPAARRQRARGRAGRLRAAVWHSRSR